MNIHLIEKIYLLLNFDQFEYILLIVYNNQVLVEIDQVVHIVMHLKLIVLYLVKFVDVTKDLYYNHLHLNVHIILQENLMIQYKFHHLIKILQKKQSFKKKNSFKSKFNFTLICLLI